MLDNNFKYFFMWVIAQTYNTLQLTENIAANTVARPVSFALNEVSIGVHNALWLDTHRPLWWYDKSTFSIIEWVKESYNKTFLPWSAANAERKSNVIKFPQKQVASKIPQAAKAA